MMGIFDLMKQKLQEKLNHLREFNSTSSSNYDTAIQLAASIAKGLAEVQSGKGFSPASGTFSTQGLHMEWTGPIQKIAEDKAREAEIEKEIEEEMALEEQEANIPWYQKTGTAALEFLQGIPGFSQGFDIAIVENVFGLTPPVSDELENSTSYQAGKLTGNVLSGAWSIVEMFAGLTLIGSSNFLTLAAGLVTAGGAIPIAVPVNGVLTVAGVTAAGHGGFVLYNTVQNSIDTFQKFQSSFGRSGEGVKQTGKPNYKDYVKAEKGQRPPNFTPKGAKRSGAFNEAKRASDIPVNEQLTKVTPAIDKRGNPIPGRDYHFKDGKIIREHSGGHTYPDDPSQNRGSHFNDVHGKHYDY